MTLFLGVMSSHLFMPDKKMMTEKSNHTTKVQLGDAVSLLIAYRSTGKELLGGV